MIAVCRQKVLQQLNVRPETAMLKVLTRYLWHKRGIIQFPPQLNTANLSSRTCEHQISFSLVNKGSLMWNVRLALTTASAYLLQSESVFVEINKNFSQFLNEYNSKLSNIFQT